MIFDWNIPPYAEGFDSDEKRTLDLAEYPNVTTVICREGSPSFIVNYRPEVEIILFIDPQREIYPYKRTGLDQRAAPLNPKAISTLSLAKKYQVVNNFAADDKSPKLSTVTQQK